MNVLNGTNLFDVSGKIVFITGSATGLGEGYAHIFAESGAVVACADIDRDGGLIVERPDGSRETLSTGEITIRMP